MATKSQVKSQDTRRPKIDWAAIERDYRTAQFTLRELAAKYSLSHQAIATKAKKNGWTQDLSLAIKQATNALLVDELVAKEVDRNGQAVASTVLIAAEVNAQIIQGHRRGLKRITDIKEKLLDQIEQAAALMPELADVIDMVRKEDERGIDKANDLLRKAMSRSGLTDDLKKIAEIDERVRKGEREAFGIGTSEDDFGNQKPAKRVTLEFVDAVVKK